MNDNKKQKRKKTMDGQEIGQKTKKENEPKKNRRKQIKKKDFQKTMEKGSPQEIEGGVARVGVLRAARQVLMEPAQEERKT